MPPNTPPSSRPSPSFQEGPGSALAERRATAGPVLWLGVYALSLFLILFGLAFFAPTAAHAQTLVYSFDESTSFSASPIQGTGTHFYGGTLFTATTTLSDVSLINGTIWPAFNPSGWVHLVVYETPDAGASFGSLVAVSDQLTVADYTADSGPSVDCVYTSGPLSDECWAHFTFPTPFDLVSGEDYLIVIETSPTNSGNRWDVGWDNSNQPDNDLALCSLFSCTITDSRAFFMQIYSGSGGGGGPEWDGDPSDHIMRINAPTHLEVVASSTFDVSADIHLNASSTVNALTMVLQKEATGYYYAPVELLTNIGWNGTDTNFTVDTVLTSTDGPGTYRLTLRLATCDTLGNCIAPPGTSEHVFFSIEMPDDAWDGLIPGYESPSGVAEDCDINFLGTFSLSGCISYLILPDFQELQIYRSLNLADTFPFSYAYQFPVIMDAVYSNEDTAAQAITVPFMSSELTLLSRDMVAAVPFADLIRDMLSAVMWFLLAYALYRMVIKSHDSTTV